MGWILGLLAKVVGEKAAPFLGFGLLALALGGAYLWIRHDAYRDGVDAENSRWEKALAKAERDAEEVAEIVGQEGEHRGEVEVERVKIEKEKIDAAIQAGEDPFDVFFPGAD